jgi:hypothetical protein
LSSKLLASKIGAMGIGHRVRLGGLCIGCVAAVVFGVFKVLPILRLCRVDHDYIVMYLSFGLSSAMLSPILGYLTAISDPGVVHATIEESQCLRLQASGEECNKCGAQRDKGNPLDIHHCRECGHCVAGFDHHCGVVGACIGRDNRLYFVGLLTLGALGLDALCVGTLAAILLQPSEDRNILGLNLPMIVILQMAATLSFFSAFVSILLLMRYPLTLLMNST